MAPQLGERRTYPVGVMAKLLMITPARLQQLVKEGIVPKTARGAYELVPVFQGYIRFLKGRGPAVESEGPGDHRGRLIKAKADVAELDARAKAGELLPGDEVERGWSDAVLRFRQRCLAIPSRAAPLCAVETNIEACAAIIESFVHEALGELAATRVASEGGASGRHQAAGRRPAGRSAAAEADGERVG